MEVGAELAEGEDRACHERGPFLPSLCGNVENRLREGPRGFLREIVPNSTIDRSMGIFAGNSLGI